MRIKNIALIIGLISSMLVAGCVKDEKLQGVLPPGKPADYFPIKVGTTWVYKIEIGEIDPLYYRETSWSLGEKMGIMQAARGRFRPLLNSDRKTFVLEFKIKQPASKQGPLEYPEGVELEIKQDELGIFEDHKQVFWAITESGRFMAHEVVTYSPDIPSAPTGSWGHWGQADGYSIRLVFFADEPETQIGLGEEPTETLLFAGIDNQIPQCEGTQCLYFIREVKSEEKNQGQSPLNKGFIEYMWFAKGKGLVRLEQKTDGKPSMVWTLVQFSKGSE